MLTTAAAAGAVTILPFAARAAGHGNDTFDTPAGPISIVPVSHASFVAQTPLGVIYVDPVGGADKYGSFPPADLILITHEHGDHYDQPTLDGIVVESTQIIANPAVFAMLPEAMRAQSTEVENGGMATFKDLCIEAIPAYNISEERLNFHPQGRDNGYVLNFEGFRMYVSGDTEDTPEMRGLTNIDLAFVCMNLPFTMDARAAASAVAEFKPTYVYPYHYRGRDNGTQDPEAFAKMVGTDTEVKMGGWYDEA
ncbi:MBL fold metallo-hydrolase [Sulfitobacter guttiformis]|uniref:L-ascorbate metabolism protein UlaG (Beta-lactamase superfamily) n=1 Tax=Sulfitobacter guttiformis TaxID=74349 RepID=A0A420DTP4_9RHOB|nr:MBL fold metallo-hydrolase [Sulfitobacter guttiformis]KIN71185.1 Zn-dependent hydrolase of the beta-lactamase fold-like protein [Sulfitobacter guttiformis KCTC 32187]RKE97656.1 L-ascorbate metabolism protein UlaG (beta-lactamase superfamily) [Sulfitobacter guttiformis]